MAKIYKANGEVLDIEPKNGTDFQLEELRKVVSGNIEVAYLNDTENRIMVLNEKGKIMDLPLNERATVLYRKYVTPFDYIVGDVLICKENEMK